VMKYPGCTWNKSAKNLPEERNGKGMLIEASTSNRGPIYAVKMELYKAGTGECFAHTLVYEESEGLKDKHPGVNSILEETRMKAHLTRSKQPTTTVSLPSAHRHSHRRRVFAFSALSAKILCSMFMKPCPISAGNRTQPLVFLGDDFGYVELIVLHKDLHHWCNGTMEAAMLFMNYLELPITLEKLHFSRYLQPTA
jgi:hypothetical protein